VHFPVEIQVLTLMTLGAKCFGTFETSHWPCPAMTNEAAFFITVCRGTVHSRPLIRMVLRSFKVTFPAKGVGLDIFSYSIFDVCYFKINGVRMAFITRLNVLSGQLPVQFCPVGNFMVCGFNDFTMACLTGKGNSF
jgi:hypothetical protein